MHFSENIYIFMYYVKSNIETPEWNPSNADILITWQHWNIPFHLFDGQDYLQFPKYLGP